MNFSKILFILIFLLISKTSFADNHDQKQEVLDAAKEIAKELQEEDTQYVMKKLNLTKEELDQILNLPKKTYWDYKPYGMIYKTKLYGFLRNIYRSIYN